VLQMRQLTNERRRAEIQETHPTRRLRFDTALDEWVVEPIDETVAQAA
jgi:hypothetical protein